MKSTTVAGDSVEELAASFANLGMAIPRHRALRTKDDKEWWCVRRWALTAAAAGELPLPLRIEKCHRPDFEVSSAGIPFGLEVTEATEVCDQREMTRAQRTGASVYMNGDFGGTGARGFYGDQAERMIAARIAERVGTKVAKYPHNDLHVLVYVNSNAGRVVGLSDYGEYVVNRLKGDATIAAEADRARRLRVSVLHGQKLLFDVLGSGAHLAVICGLDGPSLMTPMSS